MFPMSTRVARWITDTHRLQIALVLSGAFTIFALPALLARTAAPEPGERVLVATWAVWLAAVLVLMGARLARPARNRSGSAAPASSSSGVTVVEAPPSLR